DLARSGLRTAADPDRRSGPSIEPVHVAPAGRQQARGTAQTVSVTNGRGRESRGEPVDTIGRRGVEEAVENILEFRPNLELRSFLDAEDASESHALGGLPLPPEIVVVGSGNPECAESRFRPRVLIQHQGLGGIELAIGINVEERLARNPVQESRAAAPDGGVVVKCAATHVEKEIVAGERSCQDLAALIAQNTAIGPVPRQYGEYLEAAAAGCQLRCGVAERNHQRL